MARPSRMRPRTCACSNYATGLEQSDIFTGSESTTRRSSSTHTRAERCRYRCTVYACGFDRFCSQQGHGAVHWKSDTLLASWVVGWRRLGRRDAVPVPVYDINIVGPSLLKCNYLAANPRMRFVSGCLDILLNRGHNQQATVFYMILV
ncbi:hypothetical protein ABW21_db0202759 [Orbilia brochopaga]|nr:hypothetical protein ABW21_db0202759 [Drechslerella brochopaga]